MTNKAHPAYNLAKNILSLRQKNAMTQSQLSKLSRVTRASIAVIESGVSNPSLEILLKLAQAFQISINELLNAPRAEVTYIPFKQIPLDARSKNGIILRKLLPDKLRSTEMDELTLSVGGIFKGSPHIEGSKEYFYCIEGEIAIGVLGQMHVLKKGDLLCFPGDKAHSYKNLAKTSSRGVSFVFLNLS